QTVIDYKSSAGFVGRSESVASGGYNAGKRMRIALRDTERLKADAAAFLPQTNSTPAIFDRPRSKARTEALAVLFKPRNVCSARSTLLTNRSFAAGLLWFV